MKDVVGYQFLFNGPYVENITGQPALKLFIFSKPLITAFK